MYFCKNCGEPYMTDEAVMCVKCGVAKGQGNNYCHNCGKPLAPDAAVCLNCGVANKQAPAPDAKSKLVAGLLAIFLGTFGVHNFYLGYTGKAVTQFQQAGQDRPGKGWTDLFYHWYCTGNYHYNLSCCIFCSIYE